MTRLLCASLTALALSACGQPTADVEAAPTPSGAETDVRGTAGTAPPDGAGRPGTTLPNLPEDTPEARNESAADSASN